MNTNSEEKRVELSPSGRHFAAVPMQSLLEAGLGAGIALPFGCANGSCGDCRARVVSGQVRKIRFHDYALTESEKLAGVCLLCSNTADTDLVIEVGEAHAVTDIPLQSLRAKICHHLKLDDVSIIRFKLSRGKAFRYLPGQYATICWQGGESLTLPIANCPCEPDYLEFHIPHHSLSTDQYPLQQLKSRERVTIEGPHGQFVIDTLLSADGGHQRSQCLIAIGEGFAAIKPLLELIMSLEQDTPCALVWIASASIAQYQHNLARSWSDAFDNVRYVPLGAVTEFNIQFIIQGNGRARDLTNTDFYLSGNTQQTRSLAEVLAQAGTPRENITVDETSGD